MVSTNEPPTSLIDTTPKLVSPLATRADNPLSPGDIWSDAIGRGGDFQTAMELSPEVARDLVPSHYLETPWDGDLRNELLTWSWSDEMNHEACNFHTARTAFAAMNIDTRSAAQGGPNFCWSLLHANSPAVNQVNGLLPALKYQRYNVNGQTYRITQSLAQIGINRNDGIVFFLDLVSRKHGATALWEAKVNTNELPALRASSDLAWGMWNRIQGDPTNINMIMVMNAVNHDTAEIILPRPLQQTGRADEGIPPWPGVDIFADEEDDEEAAQAILGSPNGIGACYFLAQHKRQLGGNHYISRIKLFAGDDWGEEKIIFFVDEKDNNMKRDVHVRHVVREHVLWGQRGMKERYTGVKEVGRYR